MKVGKDLKSNILLTRKLRRARYQVHTYLRTTQFERKVSTEAGCQDKMDRGRTGVQHRRASEKTDKSAGDPKTKPQNSKSRTEEWVTKHSINCPDRERRPKSKSPSPTASPTRTPSRPSSQPRSPKKSDTPTPILRPSPHTQSSFMRGLSPIKKLQKDRHNKKQKDQEDHPLNLTPERLRELLDKMAREREDADRSSMEIDDAAKASSPATPSSPAPETTSAPGAFPETTNGVNGDTNEEESPKPPPHKVQPTPQPPPKPEVDAEACKAAGNKFFKAKDYTKAIAEYTKGRKIFNQIQEQG